MVDWFRNGEMDIENALSIVNSNFVEFITTVKGIKVLQAMGSPFNSVSLFHLNV